MNTWHRSLVVALISTSVACAGRSYPLSPETVERAPKRPETEDAPSISFSNVTRDLKKNLGALFSPNHVPAAAILSVGTGVSFAADDEVQDYFGDTDRLGPAGDVAGNAAVLTGLFGGWIAAAALRDDPDSRALAYRLAQGFLVNNVVTFSIKIAVRRERPDGGNFSFPSGHASNVFTAAAILGDHYGMKVGIPMYLFAAFVSVARLDEDSHWLSDTIAGTGLGLLVGHTLARGRELPSPSERLAWIPLVDPDIVGVQFSFVP